jgi:hypothetical protein
MKFDALIAVAHNLADSLGSGASDLFQFWDQHVFNDVENEPDGRIEIDLLAGQVTTGEASEPLRRVVAFGPSALATLCSKHSIEPTAFRRLLACYTLADGERQFTVTVEDQQGRSRSGTYSGPYGKRVRR